jgi:hypothetical protein
VTRLWRGLLDAQQGDVAVSGLGIVRLGRTAAA